MANSQFKIKYLVFAILILQTFNLHAQVNWQNVNTFYSPLPNGFNVYKAVDSLDGKPFVAYYAIADIKNRQLQFSTDTSYKRRLTPADFYNKNEQPLLLVNTTFFSFATNQNLNVVIKNGELISYNIHTLPGRGKDTFTYQHTLGSALGISKNRKADIAWTYTDSSNKLAFATQLVKESWKDSIDKINFSTGFIKSSPKLKKWKMQTAVGGGPVLVQNGQVNITNNQELKFAGKAINDLHPRSLIGYTKDDQLIVLVIEGRNPGIATGATLQQAAQLMISLGCIEALNLDGGGSSCMLINGKETIKPSDKGVQRSIPSVFYINNK